MMKTTLACCTAAVGIPTLGLGKRNQSYEFNNRVILNLENFPRDVARDWERYLQYQVGLSGDFSKVDEQVWHRLTSSVKRQNKLDLNTVHKTKQKYRNKG